MTAPYPDGGIPTELGPATRVINTTTTTVANHPNAFAVTGNTIADVAIIAVVILLVGLVLFAIANLGRNRG